MSQTTFNLNDADRWELDSYEIAAYTDKHLLITGKAGSGKSTFLKFLRDSLKKRMVILAPTGAAARNIKGSTFHSFFNFPNTLLLEYQNKIIEKKLSKKTREVIRCLDVLIIDEVSMVRADLMDAVDSILKRVRENDMPFGGVQLILIGDLYQLPPVVVPSDREKLLNFYNGEYFFDSNSIKQIELVKIALQRVYRQKNIQFVELLDKIRTGNITFSELGKLNERFLSEAPYHFKFFTLTLTTSNFSADLINQKEFDKLRGDTFEVKSFTTGKWKGEAPTDEIILLREGMKIIFTRNDFLGKYWNGMMGEVISITDAGIHIKTQENNHLCLKRASWKYEEYEKDGNKVVLKEKGRFWQYPIKLGYAITIHKSQGLTLCRVAIDLGTGAFMPGQLYVALSRCQTLEGILLKTKIKPSDIKVSERIKSFLSDVNDKKLVRNILAEITEKEKMNLELL